LLELLLAIVIMGVIAAFAIVLSGSVRNAAKVRDTEGRMSEIAAKAKATYRNTRNLPEATNLVEQPAGTNRGVPVGSTDFNMEAKYRFDSWGTPFRYYRSPATGTPLTITGLTVNGKAVVAALVSSGPNGRVDSTINIITNTITTAGDDIVLGIDVSQEAVEIALDDLKVLQSKVAALDAVYQGVDNNGAGGVDESGCVAAPPTATGCPPTVNMGAIDPNCGTATLDNIETNRYGCFADTPPAGTPSTATALGVILQIYSLGDAYRYDPWGNEYRWGCASGCTTFNAISTSDPRYHKFFSRGPDGTADGSLPLGDDIVP
jgi:type II secretory pathway pseudopilin PulG